MLTEIYIEALLVDEELADKVWEAWTSGEFHDMRAYWALLIVADIDGKVTEEAMAGLDSLF